MTNGEKFIHDNLTSIPYFVDKKVVINMEFDAEWWNAEYKEPTTKNDLAVDWENYKDVDGNSLDDLILEVLQNNFDCGNTYGYKVADKIIELLPSVTPQEPILDRVRAEIETKLDNINRLYNQDNQYDDGAIDSLQYALDIIDKYRESEE